MADAEDEDEERPPTPPPELSNEEKIASYKESLQTGKMGAREFHEEFQRVWLTMKAEQNGEVGNRRSRGSIVRAPDEQGQDAGQDE